MTRIGRAAFPALGSGAVVLAADERRLTEACGAVTAEVDAIDRACSRFRADSELSAVNAAGGRPVTVGDVLLDALEAALRAARLSGGDVDPTIGQAIQVLGYDRDFAAVPAAGPPSVRVAVVPGWRQVRLDPELRLVRVPPACGST
jgi:FAD:protein FMN transferase